MTLPTTGRAADAITTLKDLRVQRGLRQEALALLGQVDVSTISRIETGKTTATPEIVVRLAAALGVSARRMKAMCDASKADDTGVAS